MLCDNDVFKMLCDHDVFKMLCDIDFFFCNITFLKLLHIVYIFLEISENVIIMQNIKNIKLKVFKCKALY